MRWTNKQSSEQEKNLQNFEIFWEKDNEKKIWKVILNLRKDKKESKFNRKKLMFCVGTFMQIDKNSNIKITLMLNFWNWRVYYPTCFL